MSEGEFKVLTLQKLNEVEGNTLKKKSKGIGGEGGEEILEEVGRGEDLSKPTPQ